MYTCSVTVVYILDKVQSEMELVLKRQLVPSPVCNVQMLCKMYISVTLERPHCGEMTDRNWEKGIIGTIIDGVSTLKAL